MARLVQTYGTRLRTAPQRLYGALPAAEGGGGSLMVLTLSTNAAGGAKTNEPFSIMVPLAPGQLETGQYLRVYDDDGSGAKGDELANYQTTLPSSDMNGDTRLVCLSGIVPSIGANATRKLFVETSNVAGPSGTAITASDVLATAAQSIIRFDIGGTIWEWNLRDAFAAGETFSKTGYRCLLVDSGPTRTRWVLSGPPRNGGNPHASGDGIQVFAEVVAWKAGPGAVGGGNPITLVEVHAEHCNENLTRSSPQHYLYGWEMQRATSLSNATLISSDTADVDGNLERHSYPRSTPAAGITLSAATTGTGRTCTRDSGVWPVDILGAYIVAGSGKGIVTARGSDSQVTLYIVEAFSGTSHAADAWSIEGIGHHYLTRFLRSCFVGARPSSVCLWGDHGSAMAPTTRAAMDVLAASRLAMNWSTPFSAVSHTMTNLNAMRASDGSFRPLTVRGAVGSLQGDYRTNIGGTSMVGDIGPQPRWAVEGVVKPDADGRRKALTDNPHCFASWQWPAPRRFDGSPTNGELGLWPRADNGTTWKYNPAQTGTLIVRPATNWYPFESDTAHHPRPFLMPYLHSGRLFWLWQMQRVAEYGGHMRANSVYNGAGMNSTPFGDPTGAAENEFGEFQTREKAWTTADLLLAAICTPDGLDARIANPKAYWSARVEKTWQALKYYGPDDARDQRPGSGNRPVWMRRNTANDTPVAPLSGGRYEAPWQLWMNFNVLAWARELGLWNADAQAGYEWLCTFPIEVWNGAAAMNREAVFQAYYIMVNDTALATAWPDSWGEMYRRACLFQALTSGLRQLNRIPTGTVTLSNATVGSARTMTFSTPYFAAGQTWYVGGYVRETGTNGVFEITAVNGAGDVLTGNISAAFSGTSPSAASIVIPGPHPQDVVSEYQTAQNTNYLQMCVAGLRGAITHDIEPTTMTEIVSQLTGLSGYVEADPQFQIAVRS